MPPQNLPNANLILILGVISLVISWWHLVSLAGIILAIITLVMANKEKVLYEANPSSYAISSLNNVKAGRICAIIGLIISIIVFLIVLLVITGILLTLPFWGMIE